MGLLVSLDGASDGIILGIRVREVVGLVDECADGVIDGVKVVDSDGVSDGIILGRRTGKTVGLAEGVSDGITLNIEVGVIVGLNEPDGFCDGIMLIVVAAVGISDCIFVGAEDVGFDDGKYDGGILGSKESVIVGISDTILVGDTELVGLMLGSTD